MRVQSHHGSFRLDLLFIMWVFLFAPMVGATDSAWLERVYYHEAIAKRAVDVLIDNGVINVFMEPVEESVVLTRLQVGPYRNYLGAQQLQQRLAQQGIETQVLGSRVKKQFWVSIGIFQNQTNLQNITEQVQALGYVVTTVPFTQKRAAYRVRWQLDSAEAQWGVFADNPLPEGPGPLKQAWSRARQANSELYLEAGRSTVAHETYPSYSRLRSSFSWSVTPAWQVEFGVRADLYSVSAATEESRHKLLLDETYIQYRHLAGRLTLGSQIVIWGRADEFSPLDLLSRQDLRRGYSDELVERRLATPAVRYEWFWGAAKVDLLYQPEVASPLSAETEQFWSLINPQSGELLGFQPSSTIKELVVKGNLKKLEEKQESVGIRLTHAWGALDWGLTYLRAQSPEPYFIISPGMIQALASVANDVDSALVLYSGPVFFEVHPKITGRGLDLAKDLGLATARVEVIQLTGVPVTDANLGLRESDQLRWIVDIEFFPGDRDTRINLQLSGMSIDASEAFLDQAELYALNAQIEYPFAHDRLRFQLRSRIGLNDDDYYLSPRLIVRTFEPHELSLTYHAFDGNESRLGGYYDARDYLAFSWSVSF